VPGTKKGHVILSVPKKCLASLCSEVRIKMPCCGKFVFGYDDKDGNDTKFFTAMDEFSVIKKKNSS